MPSLIDKKLKNTKDFLPVIILVSTQLAQNIGSVARAMKNCGLYDLRLVNPRDGWPNKDADAMAAGAKDLLKKVEVYNSLNESLYDISFVFASSARERDFSKTVISPTQAARIIAKQTKKHSKCAFLFGPENSGLTNEEVSNSNYIVKIPLNYEFASLNLSQAVLIISWEWRRETIFENLKNEKKEINTKIQKLRSKLELSSVKDRDYFFSRLENLLDEVKFFSSKEMKPKMMRNLKSIFIRSELSKQDVSSLNGIISALKKNISN